mgnify:CR=1 FL=1
MSKVRVVNFEPTSKGENTHLYTIENNSGASVTLCDLGASVVSIKVPDKNGSVMSTLTVMNLTEHTSVLLSEDVAEELHTASLLLTEKIISSL